MFWKTLGIKATIQKARTSEVKLTQTHSILLGMNIFNKVTILLSTYYASGIVFFNLMFEMSWQSISPFYE